MLFINDYIILHLLNVPCINVQACACEIAVVVELQSWLRPIIVKDGDKSHDDPKLKHNSI